MCDVLVLDDEPLVRELLAEILSDEGFAVCGTGTVGAALSALSEHGARLLVVDKVLSGREDGHALAHEALRLWPGLRVIYTSGYPQALRDLRLSPRERVLPKPFRASELVEAAREMIGMAAR